MDKGLRMEEYDTEQLEGMAEGNRATRNMLLAETDWWAVSDRTMSQEEREYRQALRDMPNQEGWPYNPTFPKKP
jgi:hypothetical protein